MLPIPVMSGMNITMLLLLRKDKAGLIFCDVWFVRKFEYMHHPIVNTVVIFDNANKK